MKKYLLLILLFVATSSQAAWRAPITNYSNDISHAGRQNWEIARNSNGWVYFANNSGLLEYNGCGWSLRPLDNLSIVRSVTSAPNGDIYVGGRGEIGRYRADEMGRLTYANLLESMPLDIRSFNEVWNIHTIGEKVYFQLRREIYILDNHGDFKVVSSKELISASCVVNNTIYFTTNTGLYVLGESEPIVMNISHDVPFKDISAIAPYGDGKLLIATMSNALYIYNNGNVSRFRTPVDKLLSQSHIYSLAVSEHHIACGTVKGGVVSMNIDGSGAEHYNLKNGLNNNTVLSVMFDKDDNLWCGLDNGIDYIALSSPIRYANVNHDLGFSGYCTLQDDGYIYMGSNQGLIRVDEESPGISSLLSDEQYDMIRNSDGQVWGLQKIDNTIYCCHNRGLFIVDNKAKTPALRPLYTDDGVWSVVSLGGGSLLLCTYEGFVRIDNVNSARYRCSRVDGCDVSVRDMLFIDPLRMGYFVSKHGLERVHFDAAFSVVKISRLIESTSYDVKLLALDNKYIVYTPSNIYRINDDGTIEATRDYDHLFDLGSVYSTIDVDDNRNIWYVCGDQLVRRRYNYQSNSYEPISQLVFSEPNFFVDGFTQIDSLNDNYNIINGVDGFALIDTQWTQGGATHIEPRIIGLYDSNNRDSLVLSTSYGRALDKVELDHDSNSIHILFGSNSVNNHGVQYSYRLQGSDSDWSDWSDFNESQSIGGYNRKEYTQLFEGKYSFHLRLKDTFGNIEQTKIDITILPPWQRTKVMYLFYLMLFSGSILYVRNRLNRYYADRRRLIELQSERQIEQQKRQYESLAIVQENKIIKLKNEKLESEIMAKSAELSHLLLNKLEKNDIITSVKEQLAKITNEVLNKHYDNITKRIGALNKHLDDKMIDNVDWSIFEENFNITNDNFVQKISEHYSWMSINERKLCIYIKMGLQNKEIAPLLNLSIRGVEMLRYRIRKKMQLDRNENLYEFFQKIS